MPRIFFKELVALFLLLMLVGCAMPPSRIYTNKSSEIKALPTKIFVFSHIGSEFGSEFYNPFKTKLSGLLNECKVETEITTIGGLDLDPGVHLGKFKAFRPDYSMVLRNNGGTRDQYNAPIQMIYDVQLTELRSNKTVWRANVNFYRGTILESLKDRGEALATDLIEKMKADGLLTSCPLAMK